MRKCLVVLLIGLFMACGCAESLTQSDKPPCACKTPAGQKPVDKKTTE
jgi:hypothetical protein